MYNSHLKIDTQLKLEICFYRQNPLLIPNNLLKTYRNDPLSLNPLHPTQTQTQRFKLKY